MEFENLQIEVPNKFEDTFGNNVYTKKYTNNSNFVIGFNPNAKEAIERRKQRSKRFGIIDSTLKTPENICVSFAEIDIASLSWPPVPLHASKETRPDAILVYGVENLSTKDIFIYFDLYGPENIEWIDDYSCNVVWNSSVLVSDVLDHMSKTLSILKKLQQQTLAVQVKEEEDDDGECVIEPQHIWRVAQPYKGHQLFMRHSTIKDKKLPNAAERSEYYLKYGKNSSFPSAEKGPGILSKSRKRKLEKMRSLAMENIYDVNIVDMAEKKIEGKDEPIVKRLNLPEVSSKNRTMVADQVELQQKLGKIYKSNNKAERLGNKQRKTSVRGRLGERFSDADNKTFDDRESEKQGRRDLRERLKHSFNAEIKKEISDVEMDD